MCSNTCSSSYQKEVCRKPCLAGAPCALETVCSPARADTTLGFCLPDVWGATINKAGAGSSGGGVTGAWTGGLQGPNGAGVYTGSGQSPPPSPPRTPTSTLRSSTSCSQNLHQNLLSCLLDSRCFEKNTTVVHHVYYAHVKQSMLVALQVAKSPTVYSVKSTCSLLDVSIADCQQTAYRTKVLHAIRRSSTFHRTLLHSSFSAEAVSACPRD